MALPKKDINGSFEKISRISKVLSDSYIQKDGLKYLDDQLSLSNSDSDKKRYKPANARSKKDVAREKRPLSAHRNSISK